MITDFKKRNRVDNKSLLTGIVIVFFIVVFFAVPPRDKLSQLCFWGTNTKFMIAKMMGDSNATAYLFHRNNAIYLAKMYPNRKTAISEMDKSIKALPRAASESELKTLYKDRAEIKLFLGDYKGALNDFVKSDLITFNDSLKVALLFKVNGNYNQALSYCNNILNKDNSAYAGFACIADVYKSANRPDVALRVWDLALDMNKNMPRAYVDRALLKKSRGDLTGYDSDIKLAKQYSPTVDLNASIIEDTLHPKMLTLNIR